MNESILTSIKKLLGIAEDYEHFDQDIIAHINAALMIVTQLGVGPEQGYIVTDKNATWGDFVNSETNVAALISYVYIKVKLMFDPPQNSFTIDSLNRQASEFEWRLNAAVDYKD